ncbi:PAAR-like protein [Enterococcus sp. LJL99]
MEKAEKKAKKEGKAKPEPVKCEPKFDIKWSGGDTTTQMDGKNPLNMSCKLTCKEAGAKDTITVVTSGQDGTNIKIYCMRYRDPSGN